MKKTIKKTVVKKTVIKPAIKKKPEVVEVVNACAYCLVKPVTITSNNGHKFCCLACQSMAGE